MRLALTTIGEFRQIMAEELAAAEQAVSGAVTEATAGLKGELRAQVTGARLGTRLSRTWRSQVWPSAEASLGTAGLVWTKAPAIIRGHAEGSLIRAADRDRASCKVTGSEGGGCGRRPAR